jgi:uncharacterized membrane protein HdeD (DUF308 family)
MSAKAADKSNGHSAEVACDAACVGQIQREFQHLKARWTWLRIFGIVLVVCGAAALISPALTIFTTFAVTLALGLLLMVGGISTIVTSLWAGKWSGLLVQLLMGILYLVVGWIIIDEPVRSTEAITMFIAAFFIIAGLFRIVAAVVIQFPYWGWALLNGIITFLLGTIIYHHYPQSTFWALGLLVGVEMLFHGWTWIMLSLAIRKVPDLAE